MKKDFPELLYQAVGLSCCDASFSYGNVLCIGLGERVYYTHPSLRDVFRGEWDIRSYNSAWRLVKDNQIICGYYDLQEESGPKLELLIGHKLIDIKKISCLDVGFIFDDGFEIDFLGQSSSGRILEILLPGDINLELKNSEWIQYISDEKITGLSNEELLISEYSKRCHKRWETLIPQKKSINYCDKCSYFRPISGQFYFWDYGLCSNELSEQDGKVVNVRYGCLYYDNTLPTVEG
ncbi:Protein of unknown function (DUF3027) [Desulfosporosinus acidiphilus SJ4]|uniref:Uncharacterized protein n=1 Tax=Desulfosporosinus acidiphilus (strain DSM 22704 / JCM 16185 / SJ4) TaxID=646529 RepID=I4D3W0_DESAJ|nr:DUF3027 domain-containing protein [Desulfosporosinus acidiphilus]AFM40484.1 Protein of unknown function (DUF3027) [Desulfosporosinus acidiphilus SJ4]